MRMSKRQYRIGELAKKLNIKKFVIRFWEKELGIKPHRSPGGQRFYIEEDFETFKIVKNLLYDKKYTLAGAKKELTKLNSKERKILASQKTNMNFPSQKSTIDHNLKEKLLNFRTQLIKLQKSL